MTVSVEVKARAWGAKVTVTGEGAGSFDVAPNSSQEFHIDEGATVSVEQGTEQEAQAAATNPNDELIKPVDPATLDQLSGNTRSTAPASNKTGGNETSQTSEDVAQPRMR